MILKVLNVLILIICLFIISEIIQSITKKKKKSVSGVFFLHSETYIKGLKSVFLAITIWGFKETLSLIEALTTLNFNLGDILGIIAAIILSYGLFLIVFPLKKLFQNEKHKSQ